MDEMNDPFTDQVACARYRAERDMLAQAMERVADDIERTFLGFEGAEDAPAMRWARQFRAALGSLHAPVRDATTSACDLTPDEDREAAAWVREHGGLDVVKTHAELFQQLKGERDELREMLRDYKNHGAYGLMLEYRRVLNGVCKRLGLIDGTGKPEQDGIIYGELEKRLMPEGYEWPRFEDGEPVRIGDKATRDEEDFEVRYIGTYSDGSFLLNFWTYAKGERVKRPVPKVYDADGAEIREGDRVWSTQLDEPHEWIVIDPHEDRDDSQTVLVSIGDRTGHARPEDLTHRAPVLAADGEPLEAGQTVWDENGDEFRVLDLYGGPVDEDFPDHTVRCRRAGAEDYESTMCEPSQLTHQRPVLDADGVRIKKGDEVYLTEEAQSLTEVPNVKGEPLVVTNFEYDKKHPVRVIDQFDIENGRTIPWCLEPGWVTHTKPEPTDSWERIEEDARGLDSGVDIDLFSHTHEDLVRRCKALAERGER